MNRPLRASAGFRTRSAGSSATRRFWGSVLRVDGPLCAGGSAGFAVAAGGTQPGAAGACEHTGLGFPPGPEEIWLPSRGPRRGLLGVAGVELMVDALGLAAVRAHELDREQGEEGNASGVIERASSSLEFSADSVESYA